MNKVLKQSFIVGTLLCMAGAPTWAAEPSTTATSPSPKVLRSSQLIGAKVFDAKNDQIGELTEVIVDPNTGQIALAVLAVGASVGMGEKLVAVPWEIIRPTGAMGNDFILRVDREKLRSAPSFDRNQWPEFTDPQWSLKVYNFFGVQPSRGEQPSGGPSSTQPPASPTR